jgi:hypothetical protein
MAKTLKNLTKPSLWLRLNRFFGTKLFWYIVLGFFIFSASWVAIFSLYPMAFDEEVHLGTIRAYSELWNPYALQQKVAYDDFGAIITDPSYLFHYLMSFPYRFLTLFTHNEPIIVVILRFMNIAMFAGALILFRRLLLRVRLSPAATHVVLAVLVLVPVVPLLAGQINYDNLVMLVVAALFLVALDVRQGLREQNRLPVLPAIYVVLLILFGSIVKYAFVPIALAAVLYLLVELILALRRDGSGLLRVFGADVLALRRPVQIGVLVLFVVGFGMFAQRYALNVLRYGDPVPDCAKVLSEERCKEYGPWARNNRMKNEPLKVKTRSLPHFTVTYFAEGMWHRLYFTLAGPTNGYSSRKQLPIPSYTAIFVVVISTLLVIIFARPVLREHPEFMLFLLAAVLYIGILLNQLYSDYLVTTRPVAINGRYLLPLLPGLGAMGIVACRKFFMRAGIAKYSGAFATVALLLFLQGGGAFTYMVRSESKWFWPNPVVQGITDGARSVLKPITVIKD